MGPIEIFRPGTFTPMQGEAITFSEADVRASAAAYRSDLSSAPLVVGHPTTDAPAYGWVTKLDFADGVLRAHVADVEPEFAGIVRAGRYRNVSASFWRPEVQGNPVKGAWYLRHVGFLGAAAPAVKGLKPASFSEAEADFVSFAGLGAEAAELARLRAELAGYRSAGAASFVEDLVEAARLPTALAGLAVALLDGAADGATVSFTEGGVSVETSHREGLRRLLSGLPPMVQFGEVAGAGRMVLPIGNTEYEPPQGFAVSPEARARLGVIEQVQREKNVDFAEAARLVAGAPGKGETTAKKGKLP